MERIIQLRIDNYSIITYRIKDDVMRNMQILKSIIMMINEMDK